MNEKYVELANRIERAGNCTVELDRLMRNYNRACSDRNWKTADHTRMLIIETVEAMLDAQASVFRLMDGSGGKA